MTGRDEGCGRRVALQAAALLSRSYALARGAHAPSPSRNGRAMQTGAILTKAGAVLPQPDCNSWRGTALDCTGLHWIAVNGAKKSLERKTGLKKIILLLTFSLHLFVCKVAEASCLLALKAQRRDAAATFPGSLAPAPHKQSEKLNLVGFNLRQSNLIQLNTS
jgi:hypothetical protein